MEDDTKWEYYESKKPFNKIMKKYCDYECVVSISGSDRGWSNNFCVEYNISYDEGKLVEKLSDILVAIKKTKAYKKCSEIQEAVNNRIKPNISEYGCFDDFSSAVNLILELSRKDADGHCRYEWDIKDRVVYNIEVQKEFAKKIKNPKFSITECNGWEREKWKVYFPYPKTDKEFEAILNLKKRFEKLGKIDQKVGLTAYYLRIVAESEDFANEMESKVLNRGWGPSVQIIDKPISVTKINKLIELDNDEFFSAIYKLGFIKEITKGR
jgi:hypothetical protein